MHWEEKQVEVGCFLGGSADEEGCLMNDFTGRVRLDKRKPPKGENGT
jgi:hypothetical protein